MNHSAKRYTEDKPNLVIVHPPGSLGSYPFSIANWKQSYFDFFKRAAKEFSVYYVRGRSMHRGNGVFSNGYRYANGTLHRHDGPIRARVVYNKNRIHSNGGRDWDIVNKWNLYQVTYDKFKSYRAFRSFMKPTYFVSTKKQLRAAVQKLSGPLAVYKPLHGTAGKGVIIDTPEKILQKVSRPHGLLQEYVDTTAGIPGLYQGRHDLRITIMNGTIVQSFIRIPPAHLMVANVAQGARARQVPLHKIPTSAKKIVHSVDTQLEKYGSRVYAVDLGFENNKPYIFEINPEPGLPYKHWKYHYHEFHQGLIDTFLSCL